MNGEIHFIVVMDNWGVHINHKAHVACNFSSESEGISYLIRWNVKYKYKQTYEQQQVFAQTGILRKKVTLSQYIGLRGSKHTRCNQAQALFDTVNTRRQNNVVQKWIPYVNNTVLGQIGIIIIETLNFKKFTATYPVGFATTLLCLRFLVS